jgi:hypothetical protein
MFAVFVALGAGYNENRIVNNSNMLVWTHVLVTSPHVELELQLLPTLVLDVGLTYQIPVASSDELHPTSTLNASALLMATIAHSWDVYASGAVSDLGTYRLPYIAFGFAKRWGE